MHVLMAVLVDFDYSVPIGVPGGKVGCMFTPISVDVICYEPEVVGSKCFFENYFGMI